MPIIRQVDNVLNKLMAQYRGELGFIDSTRASDFTWSEFSFECGTWSTAKMFTWG